MASTSTGSPNLTSRTPTEPPHHAFDLDLQRPQSSICRYFKTGSCRAGASCRYRHEDESNPDAPIVPLERKPPMAEASESWTQDRRQATKETLPTRVVSRPVPQAQIQDPREYQLGQIRRRFSPKETVQNGGALLKFNLVPSDPDFAFEMDALECALSVPLNYPKDKPTLKVGNKEIPRGFTFNVEEGFDGLIRERPEATLLELVKSLDKNLEKFLSAPKAETVRFVPNKDTRHLAGIPSRSVESSIVPSGSEAVSRTVDTTPVKSPRTFSANEKAEALKRRESETRQLEARMGRLPLFKKSADGIAYIIPIEPKKRNELPASLRSIKTVQLFVPLLYPLQSCRVQLDGVDSVESKPVEQGFQHRAIEQATATLMGHVNYLAQNMHTLAKTVVETPSLQVQPPAPSQPPDEPSLQEKGKQLEGLQDPERSHIQYISRPAEWTTVDAEDAEYSNSDELYSYDTEEDTSDEEEHGDGGAQVSQEDNVAQPKPVQEKGTAISFPFIELYGIELLEVTTLNITVKCERCKDTTEIKGLKDGVTKTVSCKKCAVVMTIAYRRDFIHANAVRAGFIDLEGCFVADMLPSIFIPTCSECSTAYPQPGITSVAGETTRNVCRECHHKFSFKIASVRFLRITTSHVPPTSGPRRKKETLGITPGSELPRRGRCKHYTKSYRWFRFSCCEKVYPCDKCHDEAEEHPNEWANRMICGWCSREGNYRPEDCASCHGLLIGGRSRGGFWEGGKGTRDKTKMSRKDPRKFRRIGAATRKT